MTDQEKLNIVREWLSNIDQAISGLRDSVELLHERPAAVEAKASSFASRPKP